jgi:hypothetical protein
MRLCVAREPAIRRELARQPHLLAGTARALGDDERHSGTFVLTGGKSTPEPDLAALAFA